MLVARFFSRPWWLVLSLTNSVWAAGEQVTLFVDRADETWSGRNADATLSPLGISLSASVPLGEQWSAGMAFYQAEDSLTRPQGRLQLERQRYSAHLGWQSGPWWSRLGLNVQTEAAQLDFAPAGNAKTASSGRYDKTTTSRWADWRVGRDFEAGDWGFDVSCALVADFTATDEKLQVMVNAKPGQQNQTDEDSTRYSLDWGAGVSYFLPLGSESALVPRLDLGWSTAVSSEADGQWQLSRRAGSGVVRRQGSLAQNTQESDDSGQIGFSMNYLYRQWSWQASVALPLPKAPDGPSAGAGVSYLF